MDFHRAQLNSLIFHNEVVLPRTSPGFGEVSLAVAELQGGNYPKAAILAEIAVGKDPQLAAAWLAKTAADVFEATPDDLRKERAVFCMDRALECAPTCRREIIEFFVAHILGHYVEVLCAGAGEELGAWLDLEAQARTAESQATEINSQAMGLTMHSVRLQGDAGLLEAASLVTGLTALFSRRLGTQLLSGLATTAALSEAERRQRDAALLDAQAQAMHAAGADLQRAGGELRLSATEHRTASLLLLVPARDLIELATRLLHAEGLPGDTLAPLADRLVATLQQVLHARLTWLQQRALPLFGGHPESQSALLGLTRLLPWLPRADLERLAVRYQPALPSPAKKGKGLAVLGLVLGGFLEVMLVMLCCTFIVILLGRHGGAANEHASEAVLSSLLISLLIILGLDRLRAASFRRLAASSPGTTDEGTVDHRGLLRRGLLGEQAASLAPGHHPAGTPPPLPPPGSGNPPRSLVKRVVRVGAALFTRCWGSVATVAVGVMLFCATPPTPKESAPKVSSATPVVSIPSEGSQPTGNPAAKVRRALPVPASTPSVPTPAAAPVSYVVTGLAAGDTLNVRSGPGANNEVSAHLPNGYRNVQIVGAPVLNGPTAWVQIRFGERTGWVTRTYLKPE